MQAQVTLDPDNYFDWDRKIYFCPKCGSDWIEPEDEKCHKCGAKIIWQKKA